MRMMLVGAGAVGESILKVMQWRDPKGEWLEYVLVCDYDLKRAEEVVTMMKGDTRFEASKIDATNTEEMAEMIREHKIDFVMDAAPPFASNMILTLRLKTCRLRKYGNLVCSDGTSCVWSRNREQLYRTNDKI